MHVWAHKLTLDRPNWSLHVLSKRWSSSHWWPECFVGMQSALSTNNLPVKSISLLSSTTTSPSSASSSASASKCQYGAVAGSCICTPLMHPQILRLNPSLHDVARNCC